MKELDTPISLQEAKEWYGEKWQAMEAFRAKINETVREINDIKRHLDIK